MVQDLVNLEINEDSRFSIYSLNGFLQTWMNCNTSNETSYKTEAPEPSGIVDNI